MNKDLFIKYEILGQYIHNRLINIFYRPTCLQLGVDNDNSIKGIKGMINSLSNERNKKVKCPICNREQYRHLRLFHSHEELAKFLAFGEKYNDKILVDDDKTE